MMFGRTSNAILCLLLSLSHVLTQLGPRCTTHCDCADSDFCNIEHDCISCGACDTDFSIDWCCPACDVTRTCTPADPMCCDAPDATCNEPFGEDCSTWFCTRMTNAILETFFEFADEDEIPEVIETFQNLNYHYAYRLKDGNYECYSLDGVKCADICPIEPVGDGIPVVCDMDDYMDQYHWCNHAVQTCDDGGAGVGDERCALESGRWTSNLVDFFTAVPDADACRTLCVNHPKCYNFSYRKNRGQCKTHTALAHDREPRETWRGHEHIKWVRNNDVNGCPISGVARPCPVFDCAGNLCPCRFGCQDERSYPGRGLCFCFGASASVTILSNAGNEESIRLDELRIGDKVLSFDDSGNLIFDEVFYIYHDNPWTGSKGKAPLVDIVHEDGSIPIAGIHLIYLTKTNGQMSDHCIDIHNSTACTFTANLAEVGDVIWVLNRYGVFEPEVIVSLSEVYDQFRSPVTLHGNIIVENVAASVYVAHKTQCEGSILPLRVLNSFDATRGILGSEVFQFLWESFHASVWLAARDYETAGNAMEIGTQDVTVILSVIIGTVIIIQMYRKRQ